MTKNKPYKLILAALAVLLLLFSLTTEGKLFWKELSRLTGMENRETLADRWELNLHFLDVGKADVLLVENQNSFILVDGGDVNSADVVVNYLRRRGVKELQAVFMTHPDADHIGALPQVFDNFHVKEFYSTGASSETADFKALEESRIRGKVPAKITKAGEALTFGSVQLDVLSPKTLSENSNDSSLVIKLTYGDFSALLTGDAGKNVEQALLEKPEVLGADILKISHHGSKTASTEDFLRAVHPRAAILSTGEDQNLLPAPEVTERLRFLKIPFYRTDLQGTLIVSTDGEGIINLSAKEKNYEITDR